MRVLYVDDDRVNSLLFTETCRLADGVEVETAVTGAEACDLVRQWRPDFLVIDLHLPDTNGYALLATLRSLLAAPELPAFLCTAEEVRDVQASAREAGFDGCWTKPVQLQIVLAELAQRQAGSA